MQSIWKKLFKMLKENFEVIDAFQLQQFRDTLCSMLRVVSGIGMEEWTGFKDTYFTITLISDKKYLVGNLAWQCSSREAPKLIFNGIDKPFILLLTFFFSNFVTVIGFLSIVLDFLFTNPTKTSMHVPQPQKWKSNTELLSNDSAAPRQKAKGVKKPYTQLMLSRNTGNKREGEGEMHENPSFSQFIKNPRTFSY